jgi:hypothetical protein
LRLRRALHRRFGVQERCCALTYLIPPFCVTGHFLGFVAFGGIFADRLLPLPGYLPSYAAASVPLMPLALLRIIAYTTSSWRDKRA